MPVVSRENHSRELHTGFYSDRAETIMTCLLTSEQARLKGMKHTFKVKSILYLDVKRAIDNEVVFVCHQFGGWSTEKTCFSGISDADALNHIAWCFKQCVLRRLKHILLDEVKAKENWNRSSKLYFRTEFSNYDISVIEAYFIYDHLLQRKNAAKRYSKETSDSLIGLPLDPIMTEMKSGMLEEIERIKNECSNEKAKLYLEKEKAILKYREEMEARLVEARNVLNNEAAAKIAKIENELAALLART